MNTTTTTALVEALALVRQTTGERLDAALKVHADAQALPKGTRGKAAKVKAAWDEVLAAREQAAVVLDAIREAHVPVVQSIVANALDPLAHGDADPVLRQAMAARLHPHAVAAVFPFGSPKHGVHVRMIRDHHGLPQYLELRQLATPAEHRDQAERWLAKATTAESRDAAQAHLDRPEDFPVYHGGMSITVSRSWDGRSNQYTLNASTWQVEGEEQASRIQVVIDVAFSLMRSLNAADLPKAADLEKILCGEAG